MARSTDNSRRALRSPIGTRAVAWQRADRIADGIASRIRRQIADGRLPVGTKLPAEREMARRHKVSRVTIREAYQLLEQLGLLNIRRGAGGGAVITAREAISAQGQAPLDSRPLLALLTTLTELTRQALATNTSVRRSEHAAERVRRSSAA